MMASFMSPWASLGSYTGGPPGTTTAACCPSSSVSGSDAVCSCPPPSLAASAVGPAGSMPSFSAGGESDAAVVSSADSAPSSETDDAAPSAAASSGHGPARPGSPAAQHSSLVTWASADVAMVHGRSAYTQSVPSSLAIHRPAEAGVGGEDSARESIRDSIGGRPTSASSSGSFASAAAVVTSLLSATSAAGEEAAAPSSHSPHDSLQYSLRGLVIPASCLPHLFSRTLGLLTRATYDSHVLVKGVPPWFSISSTKAKAGSSRHGPAATGGPASWEAVFPGVGPAAAGATGPAPATSPAPPTPPPPTPSSGQSLARLRAQHSSLVSWARAEVAMDMGRSA
mmetsp:Transcript_20363/g.46701  ORF Transcript_20363/g.46701 Transcript_20363/m.46701 type:complete len:340 (+) Transcript_20363:22-1041(+)